MVSELNVGHLLRRQRLLLDMTVDQLATQVDLQPWYIASIEADPRLADCLTFTQLMRLIDAARLQFVCEPAPAQSCRFPRLVPLDPFTQELLCAAEKFATYSLRERERGEPPAERDEEMLEHWRGWLMSTKGLRLPEPPKGREHPPTELNAFLARPLSNVSDDEASNLDELVAVIQDVFASIPDATLHVVQPHFQREGRHDNGTTIYLATLRRLHQCDFAIALATPAATGVGILTRLFAGAGLPTLALCSSEKAVSRMFLGMHCGWIGEPVAYTSVDDLRLSLERSLRNQLGPICRSAARRRVSLNAIEGASPGIALDMYRIPRSLPRKEAVHEIGAIRFVRSEWLESLADDNAILPSVTLLQFSHIANELNWEIQTSTSGVPCFVPPFPDLEEEGHIANADRAVALESLGTLALAARTLARKSGEQVDDETLFAIWKEYCTELASRNRDVAAIPRTEQDWLGIMKSKGINRDTPERPVRQAMLPGMEESAISGQASAQVYPTADAALYLIGIAENGLPLQVISDAVTKPLSDVARELDGHVRTGILRLSDGIYTAANRSGTAPPNNAQELICRAIGSLLTSFEHDREATYSRRQLRNAILLRKAAETLPPTLDARLCVLQKRASEARSLARQRLAEVTTDDTTERVDLLTVFGRTASNFEEAIGYLNEAFEVCERKAANGQHDRYNWLEAGARCSLARAELIIRQKEGDPLRNLSLSAEMFRLAGNRLTQAVAEWHRALWINRTDRFLDVDGKTKARLECESPDVRIEAVRLHLQRLKDLSIANETLANRKEISNCEELITEARRNLLDQRENSEE